MARNDPTERVARFSGLRTQDAAHEVGLTGLVVASNVDITRQLKARRRQGRTKVYAGAVSALWADGGTCLFLQEGSLCSLQHDYTALTLRTGVLPTETLAATRVGDAAVYSNGFQTGVVQADVERSFGLPRTTFTSVSETSGRLRAGRYQVGVSFIRDGGAHGPLANLQALELSEGAGLVFGLPVSNDPTVGLVAVWMTAANGSTPFAVAVVPNGEPSVTFRGENRDLSQPARTLDLDRFPPFTACDTFNGRFVAAAGRDLMFSTPFDYENRDPVAGTVSFPARINVFGAVTAGVWVGCEDAVVFLRGGTPEKFSWEEAARYRSTPGTLCRVPGTLVLDGEAQRDCVMWHTEQGVVVGFPDGSFRNATERRVAMAPATAGVSIFRRAQGQAHFVSIVRS